MIDAVRSDELIPLPVVREKLGLGVWALRKARQKGLRVRKIGRRGFVLGSDLIRYAQEHG